MSGAYAKDAKITFAHFMVKTVGCAKLIIKAPWGPV